MDERLLDYSEKRGWFLERGQQVMEMTDATFQRYVEAALQRQGMTEPNGEQRMQTRQSCRRVSFWEGCVDPAIRSSAKRR